MAFTCGCSGPRAAQPNGGFCSHLSLLRATRKFLDHVIMGFIFEQIVIQHWLRVETQTIGENVLREIMKELEEVA